MIKSYQREADFRAAFKKLLEEHQAEMLVTDDGSRGFTRSGVCGITMLTTYDSNGEILKDYCEFVIG